MKYALHMAVGSLKNWKNAYPDEFDEFDEDALNELEKLLAQPEHSATHGEPVAHSVVEPLRHDEYQRRVSAKWVNQPVTGPLYTTPPYVATPPQRTWVGLTDDDKMAFLAQDFGGNRLDAMDWAEKRLKEKNT